MVCNDEGSINKEMLCESSVESNFDKMSDLQKCKLAEPRETNGLKFHPSTSQN